MKRGSVRALVIHTLNNINLSVCRPVIASSPRLLHEYSNDAYTQHLPIRRPSTAPLGYMTNVHNLNMIFPLLIAPDAHRVATGSIGVEKCGGIGAEDESVPARIGQIKTLGGGLVYVAIIGVSVLIVQVCLNL